MVQDLMLYITDSIPLHDVHFKTLLSSFLFSYIIVDLKQISSYWHLPFILWWFSFSSFFFSQWQAKVIRGTFFMLKQPTKEIYLKNYSPSQGLQIVFYRILVSGDYRPGADARDTGLIPGMG